MRLGLNGETIRQENTWATDNDKIGDMVLQIRRGILKWKFCPEDVMRAFLSAEGLKVGVARELTPHAMKLKLRAACEERFPEFA